MNNFQPRLGLAWNFHPKWVFRSSFGVMTVDNPGPGGFDEYAGQFNILQPTGDPRHVFQLQNGPGPIRYTVNADGTVPYTGASYNSRNATWRDPNLPWKHPNLSAPNTTYNLNSVTSFARFTGVLGDFSNFGRGQANVQASIRVEF